MNICIKKIILFFNLISFLFISGCGQVVNPAEVQPYLHRIYHLPYSMYVHAGFSGNLEEDPLAMSQTPPPPSMGSILATIPRGTKFELVEYSISRVEGYIHIKIRILEGSFRGRIFIVDGEKSLPPILHLNKKMYDYS